MVSITFSVIVIRSPQWEQITVTRGFAILNLVLSQIALKNGDLGCQPGGGSISRDSDMSDILIAGNGAIRVCCGAYSNSRLASLCGQETAPVSSLVIFALYM